MKIALVHDYLSQRGGAERVVLHLSRIFPQAPIYTSIFRPQATWPEYQPLHRRIHTTFLQKRPFAWLSSRALLLLYPRAFTSLRLAGFDLIISSASSFAKGIRLGPRSVHVCYCYSPTRFLWDYERYSRRWPRPISRLLQPAIGALRRWDLRAAQRVHHFIAISECVRQRIRQFYGREAVVIHPPVEIERFDPAEAWDGGYYLVLSRLIGYKRVDLAIDAFRRLPGARLVVVGDGPDGLHLRQRAAGADNIEFTGELSDAEVRRYLLGCRALILPGEEDFGLTVLEAMACGKPAIAYRAGGALDTVLPNITGLLFDQQTPEALVAAIELAQQMNWDPARIRAHTEQFSAAQFEARLLNFLREKYPQFSEALATVKPTSSRSVY